jgi:hypothetical protein
VQFTDALFGPDVGAAATAFEAWAATARRPLVVTLRDVPGADPDPARDARRARGYGRVADLTDVVVVSAPHEAENLARAPVWRPPSPTPRRRALSPAAARTPARRTLRFYRRPLGTPC